MTQYDKMTGPGARDGLITGADHIPTLAIGAMLKAVWHGKWLIFWVTVLMITLSGYYSFRVASPQYVATATLQLDTAAEPGGSLQQQPTVDEAALNTKVALVTSDAVLTQVIAELDLLSDPELNRYLTAQSPLSLRNLRTQVRHLLAGTTTQTPDQAAVHDKTIQNLRAKLMVSRRPNTYILHIVVRSSDPEKAALLANTTAASYLAHTQTLDAQARDEAQVWLQSRVTTLRSQLETQEMQIAALIATAQLQQDRGLDTLSAQVLGADQNLTEARNTLALLEIASDSGSARNRAEIAQMHNKISDIASLKERLSAQLSAQSAGLAQLHQLQLQTDATRQLYQMFLGRLHENRMQQGLGTPQSLRVAPATHGVYIGPRKTLILTIAALLGIAIGVMVIVVRHNTRKGIIDARDLRDATGLPVLAQFSTGALRTLRKGRQAFARLPKSELSHAAHGLYTALTLTTRATSAQVILSTSSMQSEGKTEHALLLAQAIAHTGKRVLILGADGYDKQLRTYLASDVLQAAKAGWNNSAENAHIAAFGSDVLMIEDAQGPLTADNLAARLDILRQRYDHIIIDGPPILHGPLARLLASHVDAIIYAVHWSKTPKELVERGLEALEDIGRPATGLILSKVNLRKMRKLSNDPCVSILQTTSAV
ncbi:GumC family protein [Roseobacter sp. CCS2]|uniref:GumC family protein n=1 Tax=Roseobacter sp. CCS2 TaxID=391593 RepID=UPI0000F3E0F4|nr:Wzz/FepE/Etk N-terminal domain-containing protein [Roseobacter sp. CCS2]EBA12394.1 Protein-tyrosine kinase [Roseobacter sp. CCS2]